MKYIFVVEALSSGRYYVSEAAETEIMRGGGKAAWTAMIDALGETSLKMREGGTLVIKDAQPET